MPAITELALDEILDLPLSRIAPDPLQPRQHYVASELQELADDIKARGVKTPITVRAGQKPGHYIIVTGERRYRATKLAGKKKIPAMLERDQLDDPLAILIDQIKENTARDDLNPLDWAHTYKRLREEFEVRATEMPDWLEANGLKKLSRSAITNLIKLLELPEWAQTLIAEGKITPSHGKRLHAAMRSDAVAESVRKFLEKRADVSEWELHREIVHAFKENHVRLTSSYDNPGAEYDLKAHADEIGLVRVTNENGWEECFALNAEAHEKLQAEAVAARKAREEKREQKNKVAGAGNEPAATERKPVARERLLDYLTRWVAEYLIKTFLVDDNTSRSDELVERLNLWLSGGAAITTAGWDGEPVTHSDVASRDLHPGLVSRGLYNLSDILAAESLPVDGIRLEVASIAIRKMSAENLWQLAAHLRVTLADVYELDTDFVDLYTKAPLIEFVNSWGLDHEYLLAFEQCKKIGEIRSWMVFHKDKAPLPPDLGDLWQSIGEDVAETAATLRDDLSQTDESDPECETVADADTSVSEAA